MAIAPPLTLSFASSMPSSRAHAITCAPNASLISNRSMSESLQPAASSTALMAGTGPMPLISPPLECARLVARAFERLARNRRDLAGQEARLLGGKRAREAARGVGVDLGSRDLILAREILRRVAHGRVGRGIAQRFPQEILELDRAHAEAAHAVGGDRIAAHRFGADAQRERDILVGDEIGRLH